MKEKKALRQSLKFRNYLIQLLREKVQNKVERVCSDPSLGDVRGNSTYASLETRTVALQHWPAKLRLNDTLAKFSGGNTEDEVAFPRWLRQVYLTPLTQPTVSVQPTNSDQPPTTARQLQTAGTTLNKFKTDMKDPQEYDVRVIYGSAAVKMRTAEDVTEVPKTQSEWRQIAEQFDSRWNFPHCCGALDGKHVNIIPRANSGSYYYNYKQRFSIVLMALVDADYKFIFVDIGCNGRVSDGGIFRESTLSAAQESNALDFPPPEPLPGCTLPIPYMVVADAAFPLKHYIQKPYSQNGLTHNKRIYNYRLSRARRVVENAFGILGNRFRVLMTPIALVPEKVEVIVLACCTLHNFLRSQTGSCSIYTPHQRLDFEDEDTHAVIPGQWRNEENSDCFKNLKNQGSNHAKESSKLFRDYVMEYVNSEVGSVHWQDNMI
uniref:DDE Tnp4 domain-containing protein n=1 Tax=Amphimedon queenslandica TaxID=400682 RepID=A0A1X7T7L1_AMPQE